METRIINKMDFSGIIINNKAGFYLIINNQLEEGYLGIVIQAPIYSGIITIPQEDYLQITKITPLIKLENY